MINELLRKRILGLTGDASMLPPERMEAENQQAIDSLSALTSGKGVLSNRDVKIAEQIMNPAQTGQISDQQLQEQIEMARYLTMRAGLQLEVKGMRLTRGLSCYKIIKDTFGLKGNKQKVLDQFEDLLREAGVNI